VVDGPTGGAMVTIEIAAREAPDGVGR